MDQVGLLVELQNSVCAVARLAILDLGIFYATGILASGARWRIYDRFILLMSGTAFH